MSIVTEQDNKAPANDDTSVVDHLLAAFALTKDPFGKYLIGLALVHEGQKLAIELPLDVSAPEYRRNAGAG